MLDWNHENTTWSLFRFFETIKSISFKSLHGFAQWSCLAPGWFQWSSSRGLAPCLSPPRTCGNFPTWAESRTHLIFWTRATKKMKSSALTRGSPMQTRFPWPRGTKCSGRKNFPSWSRNLFCGEHIKSLVRSSTSLVWIVPAGPTVLDRWGTSWCWSWQCFPRAQHALLVMWSGERCSLRRKENVINVVWGGGRVRRKTIVQLTVLVTLCWIPEMATTETLWISAASSDVNNFLQWHLSISPMVAWQNWSLDMSVSDTVAAPRFSLICEIHK